MTDAEFFQSSNAFLRAAILKFGVEKGRTWWCDGPKLPSAIAGEAHALISEACSVLESCIQSVNCPIAAGARTLMEGCYAMIEGGVSDVDALEELSARMGEALAVLEAAAEKAERPVMWAAYRLLRLAKADVDDGSLVLQQEAPHG